ncbi:MAG: hypothetical protein QNL33_05175 [Akkermansiaceae bacterium]
MKKDGPKNPLIEALMAYVIGLGTMVVIGTVGYFLDLESRAFWKSLVLVGAITPFVLAWEVWVRAVKDLENFTKREKVEKPIETLPEIDLDDGKPIEALPEIDLDDEDQFEGRMGISISQGGDSGIINFAMAAFGVWEKIEKMEEGDSKRLMIRAFEEYVERELRKLNDEQG